MYKYSAYLLRLFAVFIFLVVIKYSITGENLSAPAAAYNEGILRLHVVANSDSEFDQSVKLKVRDAILESFAPATSLHDAEEIVLGGAKQVQETVECVLRDQGVDYGAQLRYGIMQFPRREYGDTVYEEGYYEALKVELGQARGQNWWCVLFPPVCLVDIGVSDIEGSDETVFESDIAALIKRLKAE